MKPLVVPILRATNRDFHMFQAANPAGSNHVPSIGPIRVQHYGDNLHYYVVDATIAACAVVRAIKDDPRCRCHGCSLSVDSAPNGVGNWCRIAISCTTQLTPNTGTSVWCVVLVW